MNKEFYDLLLEDAFVNALCMPHLKHQVRSAPTPCDPTSGMFHRERDAVYAHRAPNAPLLARCPHPSRSRVPREQHEANLRLFAASPKLARALRAVEKHLATNSKSEGDRIVMLADVRHALAEIDL